LYVRTEVNLQEPMSQEDFGVLVGVSQQAVSDLVGRSILAQGESAGAWLLAYTKHLREQAAGRGADGELARERARLAREQADRVAMENAASRRELAPVSVLELVLAKMAGDVASILQGVVPKVKRRNPGLTSEALGVIEDELIKARMRAAALTLDDVEEEPDEEDA
jgi:phage terminase Nu1 subunit (DNA packaging protein)